MTQMSVAEAKNSFSEILRLIETGAEELIVIARHNKPIANIVPHKAVDASHRIGVAAGKQLVSDNWDSDETNAEIAALFEV